MNKVRPELTMVSNDIHLTSVFGDAQRMILHARAAANVPQNQNLDPCLWIRQLILLRI